MIQLLNTRNMLAIALILFVIFQGFGVDFIWAQQLFDWQGGRWQLQHHWFTEQILHQSVRQLNQLVILLLLVTYLWQKFGPSTWYRPQFFRQLSAMPFGLLLLSVLVNFAIIALLKRLIPMECPWDLQQFGGELPYIGLLSARPAFMADTQCFPAGHASIGFAWCGIYYFLLQTNPSAQGKVKAVWALMLTGALGFVLGFGQQLRGAHFFSHDIASASICWLSTRFIFVQLPNIKKLLSPTSQAPLTNQQKIEQ